MGRTAFSLSWRSVIVKLNTLIDKSVSLPFLTCFVYLIIESCWIIRTKQYLSQISRLLINKYQKCLNQFYFFLAFLISVLESSTMVSFQSLLNQRSRNQPIDRLVQV